MYDYLVLLSEAILSAYPILIKRIDASVFFQTGLRMAVYTVLAVTAAAATGSPVLAASLWSTESLATGLLNLTHVGTSYTAFEQLPAGNAMALFYLYPVFNLLGAAAVLGEQLPLANLPWMAVAFAGAVLLAQPTPKNWTLVGVICALLAAVTETCIYLWFKAAPKADATKMKPETAGTTKPETAETKKAETSPTEKSKEAFENAESKPSMDTQPWTKMIQLYGSSGVLWALLAIVLGSAGYLAKNTFRMTLGGLGAIALFNSLVGFSGYALRFYLIPRVSTLTFSVLSFSGVVSAYGFGWLFQGEVPNLTQLMGAIAIIVANGVLMTKQNV
jgi:drug/metabolite transporter (DMT)-like permease